MKNAWERKISFVPSVFSTFFLGDKEFWIPPPRCLLLNVPEVESFGRTRTTICILDGKIFREIHIGKKGEIPTKNKKTRGLLNEWNGSLR
jgi:hypothetical protein